MKVSAKSVTKRKVQKKTGPTIAQVGTRSDERSQRLSESGRQTTKTSKKELKWQRGNVTHPLSESQWNRYHFSVKKWKSEKHKNWEGRGRHDSRRFQGPRCHRWLFAGYRWKVLWMVSGREGEHWQKKVKTTRERTQRPLKKTARVKTQAPPKVEVIRWNGGEFKKSGRKSGKKEEEKEKEGEIQKSEMVEEV